MSSLGQLVAGVAHEINNPVNFIAGNLGHAIDYANTLLQLINLYHHVYPLPPQEIITALEDGEIDFLIEDFPKMLSSMKVGTDRIQKIVLSLRNFSRMDESDYKPVDIHTGIDSTLMILQSRLKANYERPEIKVVKEYGDIPLVECYAGQLNQVFMNILANAIDALEDSFHYLSDVSGETPFQPEKTLELSVHKGVSSSKKSNSFSSKIVSNSLTPAMLQIKIRTELSSQNQLRISIMDNGLGMPEEIHQKIFNPFFTTKSVGKGTGMGLSISYQIITGKHQGEIKCVSTPHQGTTFIIDLPLHLQQIAI